MTTTLTIESAAQAVRTAMEVNGTDLLTPEQLNALVCESSRTLEHWGVIEAVYHDCGCSRRKFFKMTAAAEKLAAGGVRECCMKCQGRGSVAMEWNTRCRESCPACDGRGWQVK